MIRIASFNVENLFARPKAFDSTDVTQNANIIAAYEEVNDLFAKDVYTQADKDRMVELLVTLDIYFINHHDVARRRETPFPEWAWFRKNRGSFDRQPDDTTEGMEITAAGRDSWIGWVELATEAVNETATQMTAKVIKDVNADIIGIVEAENRPSLKRFNEDLLDDMYRHVMLVDGNDERGIDVAIMTKIERPIGKIRSNVDTEDAQGLVFSRDCPQYEVTLPSGTVVHVLVNHFKSQSGGGGDKRLRQATQVRSIVDALVADGQHVVVLGDLNEGPEQEGNTALNLAPLYGAGSPLVECYALPNFDVGPRPGTYDSQGIRNRLDYIFISQSLVPHAQGGGVFRMGVWGNRQTRPTAWDTYPEMTKSAEQASDHACLYIDLDL